jgi:hypothetical protein
MEKTYFKQDKNASNFVSGKKDFSPIFNTNHKKCKECELFIHYWIDEPDDICWICKNDRYWAN